ncbi:hypothetical protein [Bilophila sp.]|uniref:hypothetical protein n=1 Tax=Bilophila sp. TaxID=1929485 RepID=UPI00307825CB
MRSDTTYYTHNLFYYVNFITKIPTLRHTPNIPPQTIKTLSIQSQRILRRVDREEYTSNSGKIGEKVGIFQHIAETKQPCVLTGP